MLLDQFILPPFRSDAAASEFWSKNDERKFEMRQFFLWFGAIAFLMHGFLDIVAGGAQANLLLFMRVTCVVIMASLAYLFSRRYDGVSQDTLVTGYAVIAALTIIAMTVVVEEGTAANTYPFGLVILFAYAGTVLVPRCIKMAKLCGGIYLLYGLSVPFSAISSEALVVNAFFVTVGIAAVCLGSVARERLERQQVEVEQSIRELNEDLEFSRAEAIASRDAAIDARRTQAKFITSVSHELRTPLNAIIGFSDLMLNEIDGPVTPPSYKGYVGDIHRSGKGLLLNINDLLDVHRLSAGKMSWTDARFPVEEMVINAVSICQHEAEQAGVALCAEKPEHRIDAYGDIARMTQVVTNLLTNALKFTDPGGEVMVTQGMTPGGEMRVSIADTGIGIAPDDIARVRDPFQQAEDGTLAKKKGGLGLGLAIVGGILDQIGGRFEIESTLGVGTTCHVFIPRDRLMHDEDESASAA